MLYPQFPLQNITRVEKLKGELNVAKEQWEKEKEDLEEKVGANVLTLRFLSE